MCWSATPLLCSDRYPPAVCNLYSNKIKLYVQPNAYICKSLMSMVWISRMARAIPQPMTPSKHATSIVTIFRPDTSMHCLPISVPIT